MKSFIVFALCIAAATAFVIPPALVGVDSAEIQQIIDAINHPSTDPATAAALEQMLLELLGIAKPEPGVDGEASPVITLPAIVDESIVTDESDLTPVVVLPEIIDGSIISEPANYQKPPLVQIIVNVNGNAVGNPVVVNQPGTSPAIFPEDVMVVEQPEIVPEDVSVVEQPAIVPEEVVVVEQPAIPEPVIIAPIVPAPIMTLPEILN